MTAQEMNGWLHYGGGMALWEEVYRPFGVIPLAGAIRGCKWAVGLISPLIPLPILKD